MKPVEEATALVIDNGGFFALAQRLARPGGFRRVYYTTSWQNQFPSIHQAEVGSRWTKKDGQAAFGAKPKEGIGGVWIVRSPFDVIDEVDTFIMPDVYWGSMADWLRNQGRAVWGSGRGEELELDREGAKRLMQRLGLPVGEYKTIIGMTNLEKFLEAQDFKDWFVKISRWRGIYESFKAEDFRAIKGDMRHHLSEFADFIPFTAEKALPNMQELGMDPYTVLGEFPKSTMGGAEIKDACYYGVFQEYEKFPEPLRRVLDALSQSLRDFGYIGFFCTESRVGKEKEPYTIDITTRCGVPPINIMMENYINLPDVMHRGAHGIMVQPKARGKYCAEVKIHCSFTEGGNWVQVIGAEKDPEHVKLTNQVELDGELWIMPQTPSARDIGSCVGWGDTWEEAKGMAKKAAKNIHGHGITIPVEDFDDAEAVLAAADKIGLPLEPKK
jgi:hypothetical protein